jgi:nucleoside 2-deoxyribosyltransferase
VIEKMKIYLAGPLFSLAERRFNSILTEQLEGLGSCVFLPQRDGVESDKPPYDKMTPDERRRTLFEVDRDQIFGSDVFLFILDGRIPDEGACVELGMAYTNKIRMKSPKSIIGFHSDIRASFVGSKLNPMLKLCFDYVVENEDELLHILQRLKG